MKATSLLGAIALFAAVSCANAPEPSQNVFPVEIFNTSGRHYLEISMIYHGSIAFNYVGYSIQVDPVMSQGPASFDYSVFPKADLILITHEHGDHLQPDAISFLRKEGTRVITNARSAVQIEKCEIMANGDEFEINDHIKLTAVPAYNITEGREDFHPKGNGNGYLLDFDGFKVYVSGDTEDIPELSELPKDIKVAFLSVNQPYTMTVDQCINAASIIQPEELIPYHLSKTEVDSIKTGVENLNLGISVSIYEGLR